MEPLRGSDREANEMPGQNQARKIKRTANACIPCRQSKIKCSGEDPCANCQRRYVRCRFEEGGTRVTVTQKYLRQLQRQAYDGQAHGPQQQQQAQEQLPLSANSHSAFASDGTPSGDSASVGSPGQNRSCTPTQPAHPPSSNDTSMTNVDEAYSIWTSPFMSPSTTLRFTYKNKRNWIWLAPSSTWSFTTRLTILLTDKLNIEPLDSTTKHYVEDIYPLKWNNPAPDSIPDISGLPSLDHALYLFNTVQFHFSQNYHFFDEKAFARSAREFYAGDAAKMAAENRLWFVQFLLVLAFGKAFLSRPQSSGEPPGAHYFLRAMSVMPEITSMWKDSLLAIEVLALTGIYLYAIDHRESAHVYVGQAVRIAQMEGLHTSLPEDELGAETVNRCRNLWWKLYIIDRHFSSSLGVPMSTPDNEMTTLFNTAGADFEKESTLSLQVRLSRMLSHILTTIYRSDKTQLSVFLEATRSILASMVGHAQEIEQIIQSTFRSSVDAMSRETRHITLLYHQCVIVATRPVLLSVLKERLDKLSQGDQDWRSFLSLTKPLISTGIKSAVKTVQILSTEDGLLELFLPFDLEFTYGAAVYLAMANTLFPATDESTLHSQAAHAILDEMISKGNRVAAMRKKELDHLQNLFAELSRRAEDSGFQTLTLATPELDENGSQTQSQAQAQAQSHPTPQAQPQLPYPLHPPYQLPGTPYASYAGPNPQLPNSRDGRSPPSFPTEPLNHEFLDNIGISSYEFLSIVEQMGNADNLGLQM